MVFDFSEINLNGEYEEIAEKDKDGKSRTRFIKNGNTFLVINSSTIEVRCDQKLAKLLQEKYESVMQSRYFGRGGVEIVPAGQLTQAELIDLVRLSYNLTT